MLHELKILPEYIKEVMVEKKKFELRKYDRDYKIGDTLLLREWDEEAEEYTGAGCICEITYILHGPKYGLKKGYCILSIDLKDIVSIEGIVPVDMNEEEYKNFIKKKEAFKKEWDKWGKSNE